MLKVGSSFYSSVSFCLRLQSLYLYEILYSIYRPLVYQLKGILSGKVLLIFTEKDDFVKKTLGGLFCVLCICTPSLFSSYGAESQVNCEVPFRKSRMSGSSSKSLSEAIKAPVGQSEDIVDRRKWYQNAALILHKDYISTNEGSIEKVVKLSTFTVLKFHQKFPEELSLGKLAAWADSYRDELEPLLMMFGADFVQAEPRLRSALFRMKEHTKKVSRSLTDKLSRRLLENYSEALVEITERYKGGALGLFENFGQAIVGLEARHRKTLLQLKKYYKEQDYYTFLWVPKILLETYPDDLVWIAQNTGDETSEVFHEIPEEAYVNNPTVYKDLIERYRGASRFFFKEDPGIVAEVEGIYRPSLMRIKRELKSHDEFSLSDVLRLFSLRLAARYEETIVELTRISGRHYYDALDALRDYVTEYKSDPSFLVEMAKVLKDTPGAFLRSANKKLVLSSPEFLLSLSGITGLKAHRIARELSPALAKERPDEILQLARRRPDSLSGLAKVFGADLLEKESLHFEAIDTIEKHTRASSGEFFAHVPIELWEDPKVLKAVEFYEEAAVDHFIFSKRFIGASRTSDVPFDWVEAANDPLLQLNKALFGIVHFSKLIEPSINPSIEKSVLAENIKNLDPDYRGDKPLAFFFFAKDDRSGAIHRNLGSKLASIRDNYRLFVAEVDRKEQITEILDRITGILAAGSTRERTDKKVDLLIINGHANTQYMALGTTSIDDARAMKVRTQSGASYVAATDDIIFKQWGRYLNQGAHLILSGCNVAGDNSEGVPLVFEAKKSIPHVEVFGPNKESAGFRVIIKDEKFSGVRFGGAATVQPMLLPD